MKERYLFGLGWIFGWILGCIIGGFFIFYLIDIRNRCYFHNKNFTLLQDRIKILVRQASRWSTAAKQDENSMIAVLHANYGAGYLWALKDIATDSQITSATGIDVPAFEQEIVKTQDYATMKMAKLCPQYAPPRTYLTQLGGEGQS